MNPEIFISRSETVKGALKRMNRIGGRLLFVVNSGKRLLGVLTDGDIRRHIMSGKSMDEDIGGVYNQNPCHIQKKDYSAELAKKMLVTGKKGPGILPLVDTKGRVVDYVTWREVFSGSDAPEPHSCQLNVPVIIMAGGEGKRLEPFTQILPKALIPIGEKPIIEVIIDAFRKQGATDYHLILNHKGEMIESYFKSVEKDYQIEYIWEKGCLGTAGGLSLIEDLACETFVVSNCDVIVRADFEEVVRLHNQQKAFMTVLSSIQHYQIPYGVIKFKKEGRVIDIVEKPEYTFTVNAGVYVLSKKCLRLIPRGRHFGMNELIAKLIEHRKKIVTYPVNENDYIDIGQWEEYKKSMDKLEHADIWR